MNKSEEFIQVIEATIGVVQRFIDQGQFPMYTERYEKMIAYMKDMLRVLRGGIPVYTKLFNLPIVDMLDHNDPQQLVDAILAVNKFYMTYYFEHEKRSSL